MSWRDRYRVHPFADRFPLLTGAARTEMLEDIRRHGIREPIVIWGDNRQAAANGVPAADNLNAALTGDEYLADGRNRLDIAEELGIPVKDIPVKRIAAYRLKQSLGKPPRWLPEVPEIEPFILSMNVHRRHLTAVQKRAAIKAYLAIEPTASNRKVARDLGVSDPMVAKVREGERNANGSQIAHSPIERAKQAIRENPELSQRALMTKANTSGDTIRRARKELEQASEIPTRSTATKPQSKSKPEPKTELPGITVRKYTDVTGAENALRGLLEQYEADTLKAAWSNLNL